MTRRVGLLIVGILFPCLVAFSEEPPERGEALKALRQAVDFFRSEVGYKGSYVYRVSSDLKFREGEGKTNRTTGWIQPPGTPFVGEVLVNAYRACGESFLLDAAREVAEALHETQLESGGWRDSIEMENGEKLYRYRLGDASPSVKNESTLDDNKTQACVRFLMRLDEVTEFSDVALKDTIDYAITKLIANQFPNGAWPQQFQDPPKAADFPVIKASYPETWSRTFPKVNYKTFYTLNDGTISDTLSVMLEAYRIYGDSKYLDSAKRAGDFFILAQMPDPQPAWAQQYNAEMHPVWARKFEPPAITGGESQTAILSLMQLYRVSGDSKYLEPVPKAVRYLKQSEREDGQLARFYELHTNRPLYFTKKYDLTYDDSDTPTHYSFVVSSKADRLEKSYQKLKDTPREKLNGTYKFPTHSMSGKVAAAAGDAIKSLDERGAWVTKGSMKNFDGVTRVIESKTFGSRVSDLAAFLAASKSQTGE
ncbi:MAG: pectate lyase [Verrucomicrobiales bacterium]|nr:pectate lyase [Verrucomicrobiales bacterium]